MNEERKNLPVPAEEDIEYVEAEPVRPVWEMLEGIVMRLVEKDRIRMERVRQALMDSNKGDGE